VASRVCLSRWASWGSSDARRFRSVPRSAQNPSRVLGRSCSSPFIQLGGAVEHTRTGNQAGAEAVLLAQLRPLRARRSQRIPPDKHILFPAAQSLPCALIEERLSQGSSTARAVRSSCLHTLSASAPCRQHCRDALASPQLASSRSLLLPARHAVTCAPVAEADVARASTGFKCASFGRRIGTYQTRQWS
jgi:hypothetical protein